MFITAIVKASTRIHAALHPRSACLLLLAGASGGFASLGWSQTAGTALTSSDPSAEGGSLADETNILFVEDQGLAPQESYQVGLGFRRDRHSGDFIPCKPIFYLVEPLPVPSVPTTGHLEFKLNFNHSRVQASTNAQFSLSGSIGLVKLGASLAQDSATGSTGMDASISLVWAQDWQGALVTSSSMYAFTPLALEILAESEPTRSERWQANFGEYIAMGVGYRGHIGVKLSLSDHSSYQQQSSFLALSAQYSTASADITIAQMARDAQHVQDVNLSIDYMGDKRLQVVIPSADQLTSPTQQQAWVVNLQQQLDGAKRRIGLWMTPAIYLGLTGVQTPEFDDVLLDRASDAALRAMQSASQAESFGKTAGQRLFLAQRYPPGSSVSYDAALQSGVGLVVNALDALWIAYSAYLQDGNASEQVYQDQLESATDAVDGARLILDQALTAIGHLADGLPGMYMSVTEYHVQGPDWGTSQWSLWELDIRNAALFSTGSFESLRQWLGMCENDEDLNPIVVGQRAGNGSWESFTTCDLLNPGSSSHHIEAISIDEITPEPAGSTGGLKHLKCRMRVRLWQGASEASVTFHDMLGREAPWGPVNIGGGPFHP